MYRKRRRLGSMCRCRYMKPQGVPLSQLEQVVLSKVEIEVLRLRYLERLQQVDAAKKMQISQSQYQRDLQKALEKVTDALVNGKAINIED